MRMPSSLIRRFVYDEMEANLWVEFTTGRRYAVPRGCWEPDSATMHFRSKSQEQISGVK